MRRRLLVIATVGILLGLVLVGTASAATLEDERSRAAVSTNTVLFQENTTTNETIETTVTNETSEDNETVEPNETAAIGPGTFLSGAVGAHQAELEGTVRERSFGLSVAAAVSNGSKATLVANQTDRLETRLQELEQTRDELEAAFENGSIKNGTYQAQLTALDARITATERMINRTISESEQLPQDYRQAHGVNETRLDHLRSQARNLSGPEMAEIARTIGGPMTGQSAGVRGPPAHAGPGGSMGPPDSVTRGEDNTTRGPPANTTRGPPTNTTHDQAGNSTVGQTDERTMGPTDGNTRGPPENSTMGPPEDRGRNSSATAGIQ